MDGYWVLVNLYLRIHLFACLCRNLMCRSLNCVKLRINHIQLQSDSLSLLGAFICSVLTWILMSSHT